MNTPPPSRRWLELVPDQPGTCWAVDPTKNYSGWLAERRRALDRLVASWQAEGDEQQLSLEFGEAA
jgi:hypothetical protein